MTGRMAHIIGVQAEQGTWTCYYQELAFIKDLLALP